MNNEVSNVISLENYKLGKEILSEYKDLLSTEDLSKIFEASKNTIYKAIREGKFGTPIKIGRSFKIPKLFILRKYFANYQ